jgi:hypothetical protein
MTVAADSQELEVQPAVGGNPAVEPGAVVGYKGLGYGAVKQVGAMGRDVHVAEEVMVHVRAIALGIKRPNWIELVEIVGDDVTKREFTLAMERHQVRVYLLRSGSG